MAAAHPPPLIVGYTIVVFVMFVFLAGIYFMVWFETRPRQTTKTVSVKDPDCPDVLIQHGKQLLLINTQKPTVEGLNPIRFGSLDDYMFYAKQQNTLRANPCPILFLQLENDSQGKDVYRVRPGPFSPDSGGAPSAPSHEQISAIQAMLAPAAAAPSKEQKKAAPTLSDQSAFFHSDNYTPFNAGVLDTFAVQTQPPPTPVVMPPIPTQLNNPLQQQQQQQQQQATTIMPLPPTVRPILPPLPPGTAEDANASLPPPVKYIDASRDDPPFNQNMYAGFDPIGLYVGVNTDLDVIHRSTEEQQGGLSDNAMDSNWGGVSFTRAQVQSGKYDDNMVQSVTYSSPPNTFTIPSMRPFLDNTGTAPAIQ
jgi:hypothetical protein